MELWNDCVMLISKCWSPGSECLLASLKGCQSVNKGTYLINGNLSQSACSPLYVVDFTADNLPPHVII